MLAPLQIILTEADDNMLGELRTATTVTQRTRDRAHIFRLNAQGWNVPAIVEMFECHEHTVRATIRRLEACQDCGRLQVEVLSADGKK